MNTDGRDFRFLLRVLGIGAVATLSLFILATLVSCGPPPTPWERYSTGACVDGYFAYETDDPGPYCPHPNHYDIHRYVTEPEEGEGRPALVVVCACFL